MLIKSIVLGYDIRKHYGGYYQYEWDYERRERFLISNNIVWPLSIDTTVWPSLFRVQIHPVNIQMKDDNEVAVQMSADNYIIGNLWQSHDSMVEYYDMYCIRKQKTIPTVFTLHTWDEPSTKESTITAFPHDNSLIMPSGYSLVGYDIADQFFVSSLSNCGYGNNEGEGDARFEYASYVNDYGLFGALNDAIKFKSVSNISVKEHAPFYVYGVHCKPETMTI